MSKLKSIGAELLGVAEAMAITVGGCAVIYAFLVIGS